MTDEDVRDLKIGAKLSVTQEGRIMGIKNHIGIFRGVAECGFILVLVKSNKTPSRYNPAFWDRA